MSTPQATNLGQCPSCKQENMPLKEVYGIPVCEKCATKCYSEKVRKRIREAYERQLEQKKRELWNKRVDLLKKGVKHFTDKNFNDALRSYKEYVNILENHYHVPPNGLSPNLFDPVKEAGDILMIAGLYWDMAKIYDRMKGKEAELRICLNKYVEFSLKRPHLILSIDTIRKYLRRKDVQNRQLFNQTMETMLANVQKCYLAGAVYGQESAELMLLRGFRDETLARTFLGRIFIRTYYKTSPAIAVLLVKYKVLRAAVRPLLDLIVRKISG